MSRLNIYLIIILAFLLIFAQQDSARVENTLHPATVMPTLSPTASPTPTPTTVPPATLVIPKIAVTAPIESVGTDENGKMLLPQDVSVVGWFSPGFKPGEKGNAVISGHLDAATGEGAIFYNLKLIEPEDEIITVNQAGNENHFKVIQKETYPYDQVPIDVIFGKSEERRLNLITCTGLWNPGENNYSHRMVITAVLSE